MAQIKLEQFAVMSSNESQRSILQGLDHQLSDQNLVVENYETEMMRRNTELAKRQGEVDDLNRKMMTLMSKEKVRFLKYIIRLSMSCMTSLH